MTRAQKIALQQRQDFAELMKHYPFTMETLAGEEWRDIDGTDGKYQISNYGRVKSFTSKARILKPRLDRKGYLICFLRGQGKRHLYSVHRLVAKAFIPNPEDKPQVNHIDGVKWNSVLTNLEWATSNENAQHAYDTGLNKASQGEDVVHAKLTNEQVIYIRENPDELAIKKLAEIFRVNYRTISAIQHGRCYKNVCGKIRVERATPFFKLSAKDCKEICRLWETGEYTQMQLAEMFGVTGHATICEILKREINYTPRAIRHTPRIPDDVREKIRAEYRKGIKGHGLIALGKKYGINFGTVRNIINEK